MTEPTGSRNDQAASPGPSRTHLFAIAAVIPLVLSGFGLIYAASLSIGAWGLDFTVYWDAFHRWAAGGPYYQPWQAAPYNIHGGSDFAVLMPPTFIIVTAPFALLPRELAGLLWVFAPLPIIAWAIWRMRPAPWSWPILGLLAAWPWTGILIATGNPTITLTAVLAVALATRHRWAAAFVVLKPTLGPFALVGVSRRSWWAALAVLVVVSLPFGAMWGAWMTAVLNARDGGLLYSLPHFPVLALPVVAWVAGRRSRRSTALGLELGRAATMARRA